MSDLVKRLRARRVVHWGHRTGETPEAIGTKPDAECQEAADEIERLRVAVQDKSDLLAKQAEALTWLQDALTENEQLRAALEKK